MRYDISLEGPGSALGSPTAETCLMQFYCDPTRRHLCKVPKPPQLVSLHFGGAVALLSSSCGFHTIPEYKTATLWKNLISATYSFALYQLVMTIGEEKDVD